MCDTIIFQFRGEPYETHKKLKNDPQNAGPLNRTLWKMRISQRKVTWCFFNFGHRSLYLIPSIACNCLPVSWLLITKTLTFLNFSWARSQKCPSVHLSVRQNLPWFLFCRFILMVNSCIWSHFGLKSDILPFLGSSMAEICIFWAFLWHSWDTLPSHCFVQIFLCQYFWGL